mmetsp:Transcript_7704/g.19972  ORF Transcript_7704/g.19972 Transcript_7704/m.19972 type:complete len:170 (-) Transcript_7704:135-644(-)
MYTQIHPVYYSWRSSPSRRQRTTAPTLTTRPLSPARGRLDQVRAFAPESTAVLLCATKTDELSEDERARVCSRAGVIARAARVQHVMTSSKHGTAVRAAFEMLAREVRAASVRRRQKESSALAASKSGWSALAPLMQPCSCWAPPGCCLPMPWQRVEGHPPAVGRIVSN